MKLARKAPKATVPAISGSYRGPLTAGGTQRLDLRIDVDARIEDGAVLKRVSGDIFRIDKIAVPGKPPKETEIYQESWILEQPQVAVESGAVVITGAIRYWNGIHPKTTATIRIPLQPAGAAAQVMLQRQASPPLAFVCTPAGRFFRSLRLEIDVCKSVNADPTLPKYATHALRQRPPGLSNRVLTLERAYGEAGVDLVIHSKGRTVIDDSAPAFQSWTDAELHNAMEHHFSQFKGPWPKWDMWGLVAGLYHDEFVGGVMFDYAGAEGGAGKAPERQGFAVFRKHFWFDSLVANPATDAELEASRRFLWLFTHESGHAFNLMHSFEKNRENSLSWMNYVEYYDALHQEGAYWSGFRFSFDDEELLHIRHGNRPSVIMGGDPFSSGGHAEAPPGAEHLRVPPGAMTSIAGEVPLEILVRSEPYFQFLEPVSIEIRARNLLPVPLSVSATLHPEFGSVTLYVRRPDGRIVEYMPIVCKLSPTGRSRSRRRGRKTRVTATAVRLRQLRPLRLLLRRAGAVLHPRGLPRPGQHAHPVECAAPARRPSQNGERRPHGAGLLFVRIGRRALSRRLPFAVPLRRDEHVLSVVDQHAKTLAGAKIAARIARGIGMPFHDLGYDAAGALREAAAERESVVRRATAGDPREALRLTDLALKTFRQNPSARLNIPMERAVRTRADIFLKMGQAEKARDEMTELASEQRTAGVKLSVVEKIERDADSIAPKAKSKTPRKRSPRK